jgi:hypothetical protein
LGPFTFQTWVTDTSGDVGIPDSRFWGIMLGFRPLVWLEFSAMEIFQLGGTGVLAPSIGDLAAMMIYLGSPALDAERQRAFGLNLNIWGPDHVFKLYLQAYFDKLSDPSFWFSTQLNPLVGLYFPRVGDFDIRIEGVHTVPQAYQSTLFPQGLTYAHTPVGSPLGPDANGLYLDIGIPPFKEWRPSLSGSYEGRGISHPNGLPLNERFAGGLELRRRWLQSELTLSGRVTQISNDQFVAGRGNTTGAGYFLFRYQFF